MATFQRPAQLLAQMQKRADTVVHSMRDAHRELVKGGIEDHAQLTTGGVSTNQLAAMGHPFGRAQSGDRSTGVRGVQNGATNKSLTTRATKRGNRIRKGVLQPLPINRQTGRMRSAFFDTTPYGPNMTVDMGFRTSYAGFVLSPTGTRYMVARGFYSVGNSTAALGAVAKRHRARKQGIIASARKRYLFP